VRQVLRRVRHVCGGHLLRLRLSAGLTCRGECTLFQCCVCQRGLEHCGLCQDFPCQVFLSHARPLDVARRYKALLRRAEIGTAAWLAEQCEKEK